MPMRKLVTRTRRRVYTNQPAAKATEDGASVGHETVREVGVCEKCALQHTDAILKTL
jgi:hypothetical protein